MAVAACANAQVAGLEMRGTVGFSEHGEDLRFEVDEIANTRGAGSSGNLRLALWLTDVPYEGGLLQGEELADLELDSLAEGETLTIDAIAKMQGFPDKGTYYPVFVLYEEQDRWQEEMVDWARFDAPISFGQAVFEGGATIYPTGSSLLRVDLDGVRSERAAGSSARPLRVVLRGYDSATPGLFELPSILSIIDLPTIAPGEAVADLSLEDFLLRPDDGTYYLFLLLQEFAYGRWVEADELAFAEPWTFTTPIPEILITHVSASSTQVDWSVEAGYRYTLQASSDLISWSDVGDAVSVRSGETGSLSQTVSTQDGACFYRVMVDPLIF